MGEIEHFVDPLDKTHPKYDMIQDDVLPLWAAPAQEVGGPVVHDLSLKQALEKGTIANETLCYFMARTYKFLLAVGIRKDAIRFRQHRSKEMAHYAADCWDAEVETSHGWIEIAGHADRSCFDLTRHSDYTGVDLQAARLLKEPRKVEYIHITLNKAAVGKTFKKDSKPINEMVDGWKDE